MCDVAGVTDRSQDGMGSFEVEESLSIGNGFVDNAKRIFHRC